MHPSSAHVPSTLSPAGALCSGYDRWRSCSQGLPAPAKRAAWAAAWGALLLSIAGGPGLAPGGAAWAAAWYPNANCSSPCSPDAHTCVSRSCTTAWDACPGTTQQVGWHAHMHACIASRQSTVRCCITLRTPVACRTANCVLWPRCTPRHTLLGTGTGTGVRGMGPRYCQAVYTQGIWHMPRTRCLSLRPPRSTASLPSTTARASRRAARRAAARPAGRRAERTSATTSRSAAATSGSVSRRRAARCGSSSRAATCCHAPWRMRVS